MIDKNGPGGIRTESRSPMMKSGVATPNHASNNIVAVMAIAAMSPANNPAKSAFDLLIIPIVFVAALVTSAKNQAFAAANASTT